MKSLLYQIHAREESELSLVLKEKGKKSLIDFICTYLTP